MPSERAHRCFADIPGLAARLVPEIDWPGVRGIGNFIRHKYDDLDTTVISDVLSGRLAERRAAAQRALTTISQSGKP